MTSKASGLFQSAVAEGALSRAALAAIDVRDIGADINAALGASVDDVKVTGEMSLLNVLLDDSSSIRFVQGNTEEIRKGTNLCLDSLTESQAAKHGVMAMITTLNRGLHAAYMPVADVPRLDASNYNPNGHTPLYDKSILLLGTALAKCQEFMDGGVPCRTINVIVTDGRDEGSSKTARDVRAIVEDMLKTENHIVAFIGISDGNLDFRSVAREMGIRDEWILTPGNSPSEIRRAFGTLSKSTVRVSQARGSSFSQTAAGGFGSP